MPKTRSKYNVIHFMPDRKVIIVVLCGSLTLFISMGIRQSFGLFLQPISLDLGFGRETFSLAIAFQSLIFGLPLMGIAADRFGSRRIVAVGALLYAASLWGLSAITHPLGLYLILGLLMGIALSGVSNVVILGAVGQVVSPEKRSSYFGLVGSLSSFGTVVIVPISQWLLSQFAWRISFMILAVSAGVILLLSIGYPGPPKSSIRPSENQDPDAQTFTQILSFARHHSGYLLLNAGFFVCGFHVTFIATHLPAYLADQGIRPMVSASVLSVLGLFNILGSLFFGFLGDRYRKKHLLSILYFSRAIVISLFLVLPLSEISALIFGGAIGFLWLATVPLTSGTIAQIFGSRYLSTLYGIVFFSHQLGSFMGVWLGGRLYDTTGSYTAVWIIAIALGVMASLVHLPIGDRPLNFAQKPATSSA